MRIDVICDVIDNYGDIGVCLRLCRDLCHKKNYQTTFFCNDQKSLRVIANNKDYLENNLKIKNWPNSKEEYEPGDVIIQAFSCRMPKEMLIKAQIKKPLIINLEYLTAEKFAENCHQLGSYSDNLESFFFFPGFTNKTGGLVIEDNFLNKIKTNHYKNSNFKISLFSYSNDQVKKFLEKINQNTEIDIFEGLPLNNINKLLQENLQPGARITRNNITYHACKMVSQEEYDQILIDSDLNLVRGEDSIVRAMICGKPFLWNIYPQEDNAHLKKLNAIFDVMKQYCKDQNAVETLRLLTLSYNGFNNFINDFNFDDFYPKWEKISLDWSFHLISLGSLTDNLIAFINSKAKNQQV